MRCLSKDRLYPKMLRKHLFSIFTIKTPRTLAAFVPLYLFIIKTLTNCTLNYNIHSFGRRNMCHYIGNVSKLHRYLQVIKYIRKVLRYREVNTLTSSEQLCTNWNVM